MAQRSKRARQAGGVPPLALPRRSQARRRDRRGRGLRGPLMPPALPGALSRSQRFDEHVRAAMARLSRTWHKQLAGVEVAVEQVPPSDAARWEDSAPLARAFPAAAGLPARIVLYRAPIEARAQPGRDLGILVLDVLVEEVAQLLGRDPQDIDPGYGD
ncbi:MAG: metallopeptidase family protein [Bifidobacteriaceae bacterium]|nr:metallopeptidase family protein [Bifidobacteriaceae bacterium]